MDFTDLRMVLTVAVILTAAALIVFFDYRKKLRQHQLRRVKAYASTSTSTQLSARTADVPAVEYVPVKKKIADRAQEITISSATAARPEVESRVERDTVTVEIAPSAATPSSNSSLPAFTIDAALWERLISSQSGQSLLSRGNAGALNSANTLEASLDMIQHEPSNLTTAGRAAGLIPQSALEELLERAEPFTGLVVSIGINDSDSSMWHSKGLMQSVGNYLADLLHTDEFCCRTAYDEFVMVCPGEQGAHSQRRLNHLSERLWDYQLRGVGARSILFSWGGVQVQNQPLDETIAAATDRMRQTKRNGNASTPAVAHRQAV